MAMKLVDTEQLDANLTSVADSIRAKTGSEDALAFPSGFVSAVDSIESGGGADSAWTEAEKIMSVNFTSYGNYFAYKTLTEVPIQLIRHTQNCEYFAYMFKGNFLLLEIPAFDTSNGTDFTSMFESCASIVTIAGINLSNGLYLNYMFVGCKALENITFNGVIKKTGLDLSPCTKLTHDSLMSAINALYDWASEGSTSTYKLTLGYNNLNNLTDAEKAIATQRGWTLA